MDEKDVDIDVKSCPEKAFQSINNRIVVEVYKKEGLKSSVNNGFAMISQKVQVKGLKVLMDASIVDKFGGFTIPKGSTVYIREEHLHSSPWAQKILESDAVEGQFMIVDLNFIEFIL